MKKFILPILFSCISSPVVADLQSEVNQDYRYLDSLYKNLHRAPELSFQEENTAKRIATEGIVNLSN